jgi:hypothetical protein
VESERARGEMEGMVQRAKGSVERWVPMSYS